MPQFNWNVTDFTEYLETLPILPIIADYEVAHTYWVTKEELALTLTVHQFESVVCLTLCQHNNDIPIIEFALFVRGMARYVNDKRGAYLELQNCIIAPDRFSYQQMGNPLEKTDFSHGLIVRIAINPHIQIRYMDGELRCRST